MTRQKKSRKTGTLGAKSQPKNLRQHKPTQPGKKADKVKGRPAGSRHSIDPRSTTEPSASSGALSDPRIGSKRKIPLNLPTEQVSEPVSAAPAVSKATESVSDDGIKLAEDEFARLENDPRLQDLLAQLDAGEAIGADDQEWVDAQLDRYRQLADQLGVDLDEFDAEDEDEPLEPWQKFENPKDWI